MEETGVFLYDFCMNHLTWLFDLTTMNGHDVPHAIVKLFLMLPGLGILFFIPVVFCIKVMAWTLLVWTNNCGDD